MTLAMSFLWCLLAGDLESVKAEPNLEKRSEKAMANASAALAAVRARYEEGDLKATDAALAEVLESVEMARTSLLESGKNLRRSRSAKKAELGTRDLARKLGELKDRFSVDDRRTIEKVHARVTEIHDELLNGVLSRKE
ncbi:MAG: hypothetical protein K2X35_19920 [Bryobacteraceae bacterium]|nr:hypothetical protein [Bryobacteraceae bacterium]